MRKTILMIIAVVMGQSVLAADKKPLIADPTVGRAIQYSLLRYSSIRRSYKAFTEADLAKVDKLDLKFTSMKDASFKDVAKLKNLKQLSMAECYLITDAGLKEVAKMEKLTYLNLYNAKITDVGLKEVTNLKNLERLNLGGSSTSLKPGNFKNKSVGPPEITDVGLKDLAKLQQLTFLWLGSSQITDAGLKEVAKLKNLERLRLGTHKGPIRITDGGLMELAKLKQLGNLSLYHTQITDAGVAQLQKALPRCRIEHFIKK